MAVIRKITWFVLKIFWEIYDKHVGRLFRTSFCERPFMKIRYMSIELGTKQFLQTSSFASERHPTHILAQDPGFHCFFSGGLVAWVAFGPASGSPPTPRGGDTAMSSAHRHHVERTLQKDRQRNPNFVQPHGRKQTMQC